ncbi:unnamed protein product [Rotaria sordida]|uniref:Integrase catalytic domain-containing protein n=1 Tax=Rotaria sordida TaxID=392033 RepID=A0A819RQZ8_9BILA|nr:unnamed protein product [Rotaria sordida]
MIATPVQSPVVLQRQKPGKARHEVTLSTATTNSSATTCSTAISILTTSSSMTKWKNDFVAELLKLKNKSLNNPFFSPERYNQTIELINNAKLKSNAQRSDQEVSLLKTYDVINVGTQQKLVKNINSSEGNLIKYYVTSDEIFDIIQNAHTAIGHRGIKYTMKEIKKKYINITEKQIKLFLSGCYECKVKRSKPKHSSKLVINPITSNDFNSRGQVDLIDMQSCPDGPYKFILNYQDHFTKFCSLKPLKPKTAAEVAYQLLDIFTTFGAPEILQSDNGREFVAKVIQELAIMWKDLKIVHGRARHPQSQGSVEQCNQDVKLLMGTWIRENNCTNWAQGLRFVQFQKNSCHHRVLGNSPYSVLFGNQPKIGLASTSLPPLIFNNLSTEEELQKELGLPTCDTNDSDQCESDLESDEDGLDVGGSNVNVISYENTDMKLDQTLKPLNDRIRKTGEIRQVAKEGKKRQADQFLQSTAKKQKLAHINIGDNVLVSVPEIDRGPTDARNVLAVVMDIKHDKYKLGTEQGVLHGYYSFHQLSKAPGTSTLLIENVTEGGTKSLREIFVVDIG